MTTSQAVKALRKHMRKTQQAFATDLAISISALNNYERKRIPEPRQLLAFERAALNAGRSDLAKVFEAAVKEALGLGWTIPPDEQGIGLLWWLMKSPPRDEFELWAVGIMLGCLRGLRPPAETQAVVEALAVAAAGDPEGTRRFWEEALRRNLVKRT